MNGAHPLASTRRSKGNLLSTYLVSDEEDEPSEPLERLCSLTDPLNGVHNERLEILAPRPAASSSHNLPSVRALDSTGCDSTASVLAGPDSGHQVSPRSVNLWSDDTIDSSTPRRSQYRITFEIIRAKTITAIEKGLGRNRLEKRRYVSYTVLIKRVPGLETKPAVIERRYSDFLNFYNAIKKKYPGLTNEVAFPKKILIGNFSPDVIEARSRSFQNFLTYCLSVPEIRSSQEFTAFLAHPELREAKICLQKMLLEDAFALFENAYFSLDKLNSIHTGRTNPQLVHTLCCMVGCLSGTCCLNGDNAAEAKKLAEKTFEILFENSVLTANTSQNGSVFEVNNLFESCDLVLPLILLSLRFGWFTGKRKISLENKLEELCRKRSLPRNFDSQPTLLERILKKDFSPIID